MEDTDSTKPVDPREQVPRLANEIKIKLLEAIKSSLENGKLAKETFEAYEVFCRAERTRCGY